MNVCNCPGCPAAGLAPHLAERAADLLERLDRYITAISVEDLADHDAISLLEIGMRVQRVALGMDPPGLLVLPEEVGRPAGSRA